MYVNGRIHKQHCSKFLVNLAHHSCTKLYINLTIIVFNIIMKLHFQLWHEATPQDQIVVIQKHKGIKGTKCIKLTNIIITHIR